MNILEILAVMPSILGGKGGGGVHSIINISFTTDETTNWFRNLTHGCNIMDKKGSVWQQNNPKSTKRQARANSGDHIKQSIIKVIPPVSIVVTSLQKWQFVQV